MKTLIKMFAVTCLFISSPVMSVTDLPLEFSSVEQEQSYRDLTEELRCLVCQNQSLADSNSELAHDLRMEVYRMLVEGKNKETIVDYLVHRYGDFVLYRPPFKLKTFLLWLGPIIFLCIGIYVLLRIFKKQPERNLSDEEKDYTNQLLKNDLPGEK